MLKNIPIGIFMYNFVAMKAANMSKAEKTREYIIQRSAPVFNRKGYAATSLTDIMEATGLTKGSIYGNFENKDEVAIAVYRYNIKMLYQRLAAAMEGKTSARDKLLAFTGYYRTSWKKIFEKGGCPIQNASVEADDSLEFLKEHVQHSIRGSAKGLSQIIEEGKAKGEFKKNLDAKEYAYTMMAILEGGIMLAKIMNNHKRLFQALDRIEKIMGEEMKK